MRPFHYERATDAAAAVAAIAQPGTMYLGGGTNLVDLMKLGVQRPRVLVDVSKRDQSVPVHHGHQRRAFARHRPGTARSAGTRTAPRRRASRR